MVLKALYVQKTESVIMVFVVLVKKDKMFVNECYKREIAVVNPTVYIYGHISVPVHME